MKKRKSWVFMLITLVVWACNPVADEEEKEDVNNAIPEIVAEVNAIAVDKNNTKWIGTNEGLYKSIEGGYELIDLSVSGKILALLYDESEDLLWIGTETMLLNANISDDNITEETIPLENLSNPKVVSFYFGSDSKQWFGTEKGISLKSGETWKKENFRVNSQNKFFSIAIEDFTVNSITSWDGDYFFATSGARLYRAFDYNESVDAFSGATQWQSPYNGQSITDTMFVVFIDKEGKQWMGGKDGIQVHTGHDPKDMDAFTYYYDELPDNYILAINQASNGDIWVGTRKGLGVFDGTNWEIITEGLPDLYVSSIAFDDDGSVWVGTKKGIVNLK